MTRKPAFFHAASALGPGFEASIGPTTRGPIRSGARRPSVPGLRRPRVRYCSERYLPNARSFPRSILADAAAQRSTLFVSPSAARRRARALEFLAARGPSERLLVIGASGEAAFDLVREAARARPAGFGWHRLTLQRLAASLAAPALAARGLSPLGSLSLEALCARMLHVLARQGGLRVLGPVASMPGTPRALARTLGELRLAGVRPEQLAASQPELALLLRGLEEQLARGHFADRSTLFSLACERLRAGGHELARLPLLLCDVPVNHPAEQELVAALRAQAPPGDSLLAVAPEGDLAIERLVVALRTRAERDQQSPPGVLAALQRHLFAAAAPPPAGPGEALTIFSAPGESRECVEVARRLLAEAGRGVAFDNMAVLLRAPLQYRAPLEEALARAGVPAWFARGTVQPDPSGRAFLALLGCRADGLSAHAFAEYLSLGEVPDVDSDGAPPQARPEAERWVPPPPGEELLSSGLERAAAQSRPEPAVGDAEADAEGDADAPARRAPWRWEQLLLDAAVIGGGDPHQSRARWERRLAGQRQELARREAELRGEDEVGAERAQRARRDLEALRDFALPLLDALLALPEQAPWSQWLAELGSLSSRALREPGRVQSLLAELAPLGPVGPVGLAEVQVVLARRLGELPLPPPARRAGRVFVGPVEAARGLSFEVVFAPGLAERLFPQKLIEDPLLPDLVRAGLAGAMTVAELQQQREQFAQQRVDQERLALRLAVGAAEARLVASWPRLDLAQQARPRVPSFYALELVRAGEGTLPGFGPLQLRASNEAGARAAWPAPRMAANAIDAAEHDLALLAEVIQRPEAETRGILRYLLNVSPALGRALRLRARRPRKRWLPSDGLIDPSPEAREALRRHQLEARSYSPTALQNYAACPYRFLLSAIHRLEPREEPQAIDALDPLSRGSLLHEVQFKLLAALEEDGLLPIAVPEAAERTRRLETARARLASVLQSVALEWKDKLAPAIGRVWDDGIASIDADLRELLGRVAEEPRWAPWRFELSFGLPDRGERDRHSFAKPAMLDGGLQLRGSIDLVERAAGGALRATDYKTGKVRAEDGVVIGGGKVLQPALYALALEKLFPEATVEAGRLWYCTHTGDYTEVMVPLDARTRASAGLAIKTVGDALAQGFFPAAPAAKECEWCDYRSICGDGEELRASRKSPEPLVALNLLRSEP